MTAATMSDAELETRLTATLQAVAEQTHVEPEPGLRPPPSDDIRRTKSGSRYLWLAVAATLIVAVGTVGSFMLADRPGRDLDTIDPAASPDGRATVSNGIEPWHIGADNVLYLLPPSTGEVDRAIEGQSGSAVGTESDRSSIVVGRVTPEGAEDLVLIFHSTSSGLFAIDDQSSETVAGRELFNSFHEGVAERLGDDTWIVYQTEFGDPRLEDLVAGTSVVDGLLVFGGGESDIEVVAGIEDNGTDEIASLARESDDGLDFEFRLVTRSAADENEAMVLAAELGARRLVPTTVDGRPGYVFSSGVTEEQVTILSWSPIEGHVAAFIAWGLDEQEATDFAASLEAVDARSWNETVEG